MIRRPPRSTLSSSSAASDVYKRQRLFRQIPNLFKTFNLDMVIAEIGPTLYQHFQKMNGYIVPEWVSMRINIDRPLSEICRESVSDFSDVKRKIRKYNLTYEMITDQVSY